MASNSYVHRYLCKNIQLNAKVNTFQGIMALFPYMKKRIVTIDREQLDLLLTNTTVKIEDLKDNFKDILPEGK